jgi:hypothetical protein
MVIATSRVTSSSRPSIPPGPTSTLWAGCAGLCSLMQMVAVSVDVPYWISLNLNAPTTPATQFGFKVSVRPGASFCPRNTTRLSRQTSKLAMARGVEEGIPPCAQKIG